MKAGPLVVSNTTPVSNLIRIQQLNLLEQLFGNVVIPDQVAEEMEAGKHVLGPWRQAPGADALIVKAPLDGPFLRSSSCSWALVRRQRSLWPWRQEHLCS
jgi:uncharacterized protein